MRYSYFCTQCGMEDIQTLFLPIGHIGPQPCTNCGGLMKRGVHFHLKKSLQPHYNNSVGQYVSNEMEFSDALKVKSEEMSARTGMTHNYQPVDITDMKANGVTDEGLEETHRRHHDNAF